MNLSAAQKDHQQEPRSRIVADLTLLLVAIIWGSAFVVQRLAAVEISVYFFNGLRFLLAGLALAPLAGSRFLKDPLAEPLRPGNLGGVLLAGGVMVVGSALQQAGMKSTTAGNAGFITGLYVVIIPLFLALVLGRRVRRLLWAAALLAVIGLFLLSTGGEMRLNSGDLLELAGAFFWAMHVLIVSRLVQRMDVLQFAAGQYLVCGLINMAIGLVLEPGELSQALASGWMLAYAGLLSVGVGYTLQAAAQRTAPPADAAIILSGEAVFAALAGWIFLGEALNPIQLFGCGVMMAGMLLAQSDIWIRRSAGENREMVIREEHQV